MCPPSMIVMPYSTFSNIMVLDLIKANTSVCPNHRYIEIFSGKIS